MPPKGKDKKGKQQQEPPDAGGFTRRPLPVSQPCDARQAPRNEQLIVSAHHAFEEWDEEEIAAIDWGMDGADAFEDVEGRSCLPQVMSERIVHWMRPATFLHEHRGQGKGEEEDGQIVTPGGAPGKSEAAEKTKGKSKAKDKLSSLAPAPVEDAAFDGDGNRLPRVFVPRNGDIFHADTKVVGTSASGMQDDDRESGESAGEKMLEEESGHIDGLPRGFQTGWNSEQLDHMAKLCVHPLQHEQPQSPVESVDETSGDQTLREAAVQENILGSHEGNGSVPKYLEHEAVVRLGEPAGGDIDSSLTSVFKAVGQLSPTCSKTGCPLLWQAICPQNADKVPCYNPSGRYFVKLFAAGRWRKIEVEDSIPIDAAKHPITATSEDPVELWPLLLSKALYKLYHLGGYGMAEESAAAAQALVGGHIGNARSEETRRGRFVAFALHSLTGWTSSVSSGAPSMEDVMMNGTPGVTPDDLLLPALPPVDENEEAARERREERKRRQALFLHKKRKPRKVERRTVSAQERADVEAARRQKMEAITAKVMHGDRREVYVICMPGELAHPVLAVCTQTSPTRTSASDEETSRTLYASVHTSTTQSTSGGGHHKAVDEAVDSPSNTDNPAGDVVAGDVVQVQRQEQGRGEEHQPTKPSTNGANATVVNMASDSLEKPPIGFLLRWEPPEPHRPRSEVGDDEHPKLAGDPLSTRPVPEMTGKGGDASSVGQKLAGSTIGAASSLAGPICRWVTPREIERAGGIVVRALTKANMKFFADVQYHWRIGAPAKTEAPGVGAKPGKGKAGKAKVKGASSKKEDVVELTDPEEDTSPETDRPLPFGTGTSGAPQGMRARDPGCPPAIYLRIDPTPRSELSQDPARGAIDAADAARPESDVGVRRDSRQGPTSVEGGKDGIALRVEAADPESSAEQGQEKDSSSNSKNGGPVSLEGHGEGDSSADTYRDAASPNDAKGEHGSEVSLKETPEGAGQGIHQEEEEVEVMMCLWADQAGASVGQDATRESHALAVLQEVVPTGPASKNLKAVSGGGIILRTRHIPTRSGLPLTAATTSLRLSKGGASRVFRVILQPGLGCCVGFGCTHNIETGDAGQVWEDAGYSQITETGKYDGAGAGAWRLLFRRGFRVADQTPVPHNRKSLSGMTGDTSPETDRSDEHVSSEAAQIAPHAGDSGDQPSEEGDRNGDSSVSLASTTAFVKAILHLPDEAARPLVRLAFIDEDNGAEMLLPLLHTNSVALRGNKNGYTVLATACGRTEAMAKGAWRLQLLSDRPLLPLAKSSGDGSADSKEASPSLDGESGEVAEGEKIKGATTAVACCERAVYGGVYVPNKYLILFRDVLTCGSPLPFAARLRCSVPDVCLRLTFTNAATGALIRDVRGRHLLQVLSITPPEGQRDATLVPSQKDAGKSAKSKAPAADVAADAAAAAAAPPGKIIVQATLDCEHMKLPPHFASQLPYYFQPTPEGLAQFNPDTLKGSRQHGSSGQSKEGLVENDAHAGDLPPPRRSPSTEAAAMEEASALPGEETTISSVSSPVTTVQETLHWWLEIVGAGEVQLAHDTTRVERENAQVESWESAEVGRAGRAALLWTQRQASKVAHSGNAPTTSTITLTNADPQAEGYADWIKARAAAVGVPVALETQRQATRAKLTTEPPQRQAAPSSGTSLVVTVGPSPVEGSSSDLGCLEPVVIGIKEQEERRENLAILKQRTIQFENEYREDLAARVEAGKEEMNMQLNYIRERQEAVKAARSPFIRDRDSIVQDMIAKAEARQLALDAEREALEGASKAKTKPAKVKAGKK